MNTATLPNGAPATSSVTVSRPSMQWYLTLGGVVLLIVGSLLSWCYDEGVLGNVSLNVNPGPIQIFMIVVAVLALLAARAVAVPRLTPAPSPKQIGLGEVGATVAVALSTLVA